MCSRSFKLRKHVSIRPHTSAYVRIRQHTRGVVQCKLREHMRLALHHPQPRRQRLVMLARYG
jgi:hypothetical protein